MISEPEQPLARHLRHRPPHLFKTVPSPVGALTLVAGEAGLCAVLWPHERSGRVRIDLGREDASHPLLFEAARQLAQYFAGHRQRFELAVELSGTPFQCEVWRALQTIPFGETRTYAWVADQIKRPAAVRAVGAAIGRNPVSIVVPCHRVIGASGKLTGFAGGLDAKARLLALETPIA